MVRSPTYARACLVLRSARTLGLCVGAGLALWSGTARADDGGTDAVAADPGRFAVHLQSTFVDQGNAAFRSPYRGPNSLDPAARGRETADVTLYVGVRPWQGAEIWADGEVDQGFGLSDTLGVAGFPSGEAYKVGSSSPYLQLHRLFLRQVVALGTETDKVGADLNQFAAARPKDRLVFTVGKFAVTDIFDTNKFAHDPRQDFMNWTIIDAGAFDYAANAWGYTFGAASEVYWRQWAVRLGLFDLSDVPNSERLDKTFSQFQVVGEVERRFSFRGRDGAVRFTGWLSDGRMASYSDALALAAATGATPNVALVRHYQQRTGVSVNLEQRLTDDLGIFARAGVADGSLETYEFTDVDQSVSAGAALAGTRWGRKDDTVAAAFVINQISKSFQTYLNAGGLGVLIGDGRLPHPGPEQILEAYYSLAVAQRVRLTFDGQIVANPAYNRDRGPVSLFAARLHAQF